MEEQKEEITETVDAPLVTCSSSTPPGDEGTELTPIRKSSECRFFRVLVAVDESSGSQSAFARAVQLGTRKPNEIFLYIMTVNLHRAEYTTNVFERDEAAEAATKKDEDRARGLLAVYAEQVKGLGFRYKTLIARGEDVKQTIVKRAEELKIDMLITGKRGLGPVKRTLLGSVSTFCINQAKCSVMVVADDEQAA